MKEKIKRISSSTWALLLALMMVVSSFSVLAATTNVNKTGASLNSGETIYLKPNSLWLSDNAKFGLYVWNDNQTGHWVIMNDDDRDGYYSASVPSGGPYAKVIFLRLKDTTSELSGEDWPSSYIWNQTADLIREDGKNCYAVTEGTWDKGGGTWSKYSASEDPVATSVSLSSNATVGKIAQGKDLILSATATGKVDGEVTYTFYNGGEQVGQAQTTTENTATTTVSGLSAGDYTFTVKVTKDGYTEVASDPINVTVTGGDGYFLYNDNGGKSFKTSTSLGEFSSNVLSLDLDAGKTYYLYVVKNNDVKNSYFSSEKAFDDSNKSVTLYDYGTNNFSDEIVFTPETSGKYKFTWTPGNGQGTLKYELESTPVAKSVNLTANPENVVVGGSTTLTANVTELNSGAASNVKYTFTEVKEDGTTVGTPQELSTDTATFTDLTNGKHYYKVTVSADGYTSVTATVEVNVNQPYNVTAKYKITENGVTYEDKDSNKDIVSVNGEVTSNTSSGTVVAKNTITNGSSTYVFAGWESKNGSFTDASKASTTFSPSADADVYAKYKKQYTVSASAPGGNGTINVEKDKYLAGDKVTININPNPGYQLKSLKRTTGISGETTDVKVGVSNNKYVVDNISSDETFVAEFEGNPLDCSMYQLLGDFDGGSWAGVQV